MEKQAGFTLIELLVVVLIIGILAAVAVPQYTKAVERARLAEVVTTMSSLSKELNVYLLANGAPNTFLGYGETLDALNTTFPNRSGIYIAVGKDKNLYRIYAALSNSFGGWWIHVDSAKYGGSIIRWQADGRRTCNESEDFKSLCLSLKSSW